MSRQALSQMTLGTKLTAGLVGLFVCVVGLSWASVGGVRALSGTLNEMPR